MLSLDLGVAASEDVNVIADVTDLEQARLYTIVEICCEVGDLVGEIDQLSLKRGSLIQQVVGKFRMLLDGIVTRVLDDALTNAKR
jgi:hypothetical protein